MSIFNPKMLTNDYIESMGGTYDFKDSYIRPKSVASAENGGKQSAGKNYQIYADNPTVRNLVENPRGRSTYSYEDFMYCAELGKLSNNHLITLRKFSAPAEDNIFVSDMGGRGSKTNSAPAEIGRLVCYFGGKDNQLSDILNMNFHATWKSYTGEIQQPDTNTDNNTSGMLGVLSNIMNVQYGKGFKDGSNGGGGLGRFIGNKY